MIRKKIMVKYPVYLVLIGILVLSIFSVQGFSNSLEVRVNVAPKIVQQGNHINIEVFVVGVSNGSMLNASIMYGNRTILRLFDQEMLNNGTFHANIKVTIGYDWPVGNYTVKVWINGIVRNAMFMVKPAMPLSYIDKRVVERTIYFLKLITKDIGNKTILLEFNKTMELYKRGNYTAAYLSSLNITRLVKKIIEKDFRFSKQMVTINSTVQRYHDLVIEINITLVSLKQHRLCNATAIRNLLRIKEMIHNMSRFNLSEQEMEQRMKTIEKELIKIMNNTIMKCSNNVEKIKILKMINKLKQKINDNECMEMLKNIEKKVKTGNYTSYHAILKEIKSVHSKYMVKMKKMSHEKVKQKTQCKQCKGDKQSKPAEHKESKTEQSSGEQQQTGHQEHSGEKQGMPSQGQQKEKWSSGKH